MFLVVITACGSTSSENNTYWTQPSSGITRGTDYTCGLTICPISDEICHVRIVLFFYSQYMLK